MEEIADGLWGTHTRLSFYGVPMRARTTVAQLSDGGLFVCSPGAIDDALAESVSKLGEVRALAAPNRFHHLYVTEWQERFPAAQVFVPASLPRKRPDLAGHETHGEAAPALYATDIEQLPMSGISAIDETWFFHRPSKTLINNDLMHNMHADSSWIARMMWRSMGAWQRFGPSRLESWLLSDREALKAAVLQALDWPFERVTVAHGEVLEASDARTRVRESWAWLLR